MVAPILRRSALLHGALASAVESVQPRDDGRELVAQLTARIALEHGVAMTVLAEVAALSSKIALLRVQYEALVRALWIYFSADDSYIENIILALDQPFEKDPDLPPISSMLSAISADAPRAVGPMLQQLKGGAWRPMNSFIHTGVMPIKIALSDPQSTAIDNTLRNSNGLSLTAAMLIAYSSGDPNLTRKIRELQMEFLDCQPPLLRSATEE
jgi:hypothetical protein